MKWKNVRTIYNRKTGLSTLKSVHDKGAKETFTIPQFTNFAVKEYYIENIDWESFEREVSGQKISSAEACETIYDLGDEIIPQRLLEQLLRYEGMQYEKIRKKFKNDKIVFHFPSDCKLNKIKSLLFPETMYSLKDNEKIKNKGRNTINETD